MARDKLSEFEKTLADSKMEAIILNKELHTMKATHKAMKADIKELEEENCALEEEACGLVTRLITIIMISVVPMHSQYNFQL